VVTRQLQMERRTGKVRRSETDVPPLCHTTNVRNIKRQNQTQKKNKPLCTPARCNNEGSVLLGIVHNNVMCELC